MHMRSIKDIKILKMIDFSIFQDSENNYLMPHIIFCVKDYNDDFLTKNRREFLLTEMRKHGIPSAMFTMLNMWRGNLVTKEKVKKAYNKKLKNDAEWSGQNDSFQDDLESFLFNIQNHYPIEEAEIKSFFTPKLTEEELKLVENKNEEYMMSFYDYKALNPDVSVDEMKKSDSKDKFLHGYCLRRTFSIHDFNLVAILLQSHCNDRRCFKASKKISSRKRNWSDL